MRVKLGDVVDKIVGNEDRLTTNLQYYVAGEQVDSDSLEITKKGLLTEEQRNILGYQFHYPFQKGDVLFLTKSFYIHKCAQVTYDGICSIATFVVRTKDENTLLQDFLPIVMQTEPFWQYMEEHKSGSVNYFITWKTLAAYEFDLPDIGTQRKLSTLLWAMERTKTAYKNMIAKTDELVKSQFVEMFGDMESNPMGWKESTVGQECFYIKDGPHKSPPYVEEGIPFISTRNVVNGDGIDWSTAKYISESDYLDCIKKCKPEKGSILYSKGGTTGIAKLVETDKRFANWVHVAVLKFGEQLNGKYFECMLNMDYCYQQSQRLTKGIANRDFVLSAIAQVKIFVPPIELQQRYETFVRQAYKSKFAAQQALADLTAAQKALMRQYLG